MEFGIFQGVHKDASLGVYDREAIDHYLWVAQFADESGFDTFWATEHHFSEYGIGGVPFLQLAHIAAITKRIRLGTAVAVPALHHPLRLIEEALWVDNLSNGRLWIGLGPGFSQYEYGAFGVPVSENHDRMYETIAIMQRAFTGERFRYDGQFWTIGQVQVMPAPVTKPHPPIFVATSTPASIKKAAELGVHCLFGFRPFDELRQQIADYRRWSLEAGHPADEVEARVAKCGVLRRVMIGDSREEAERLVARSARKQQILSANVHRFANLPDDVDDNQSVGEKERQLGGGAIAGSPEDVIAEIRRFEEIGVSHLLLAFGGRGLPQPVVKDQFRRFAAEVIPAFRRTPAVV